MSEGQLLNFSQEQQIKMFTTFRIKGIFWLNPMSFLNGFDKNMKISSMLISCNVDSSVMPSNTQDSLRGSEINANGSIPPFLFRRKI